ncbi:alpha/beta-hydrolase [Piedraia hortae CBS 480.64]|uniref:Alpha/beta-hydrolase n=1 Tax=Piedraia hortae CBS 480.64 TaxID=1314780 RepID=A0A6A7C267_9PEZI|nr:alpha/beta-hydrolase [Piedraia hortae CBS 480.64]
MPSNVNTRYFPISYSSGWSQWWNNLTPAVTEHRVLSLIPYLRSHAPTHTQTSLPEGTSPIGDGHVEPVSTTDPYGNRTWRSELVPLSGENRYLNEFSISRSPASPEGSPEGLPDGSKHDLVMLHGYGAGLGFFYKNLEPLSRRKAWNLYALDLLGMGRSSRPPFKLHAKDKSSKVVEAEGWFVDALEEWRAKRKIEKFTLLGHSLGGYLAVAYALKYPGRLEKLLLVSPVGIPENPYAVAEALPDGAGAGRNGGKDVPKQPLPRWLTTLWDANVSPFSIVRLSGPLGPRLVSRWSRRRFAHLPEQEADALHDYAYSLFRQRGSGEYALAYILAPGAYAREPLLGRFKGLNVPVHFLYGDRDWMDVNAGREAARVVRENGGKADVTVVKDAGHHVYLDGFDEFNAIVGRELEGIEG